VFPAIQVLDDEVFPGDGEPHGDMQVEFQRLIGNYHVSGSASLHTIEKLRLKDVVADRDGLSRNQFALLPDLTVGSGCCGPVGKTQEGDTA
jgi:hypothetical protein